MDNRSIAKRLLEHAGYLEGCDANLYRIRAYRRAAETVLSLDKPVLDLVKWGGRSSLEALPGIGESLSFTIDSLARTGELRTVDGDASDLDPDSRLPEIPRGEPRVADFLAIDQEYRQAAERGELATITPRRFNPDNQHWLPLFPASRRGWQYRAGYSNTALAHRLSKIHEWVVIFFDDGIISGQRTVVTENRGDLRGRRVVRGRERECRQYYEQQGAKAS
jgi:hypothetical protein